MKVAYPRNPTSRLNRLNQPAQRSKYPTNKNGPVDVWDPWKMSGLSPKGSSTAIFLGNTLYTYICMYII